MAFEQGSGSRIDRDRLTRGEGMRTFYCYNSGHCWALLQFFLGSAEITFKVFREARGPGLLAW